VKTFRFALDRALHLRRMQLETEQARLQQLGAEVLRIRNSVVALRDFGTETRNWISGKASLDSGSIATVSDFQQRSRQHVLVMERKIGELQAQTEAQKVKALEARRKVKLLETLRESRYAEWAAEADREQETFAADAFLARWTATH
jgi:flagellar export protein FliJ